MCSCCLFNCIRLFKGSITPTFFLWKRLMSIETPVTTFAANSYEYKSRNYTSWCSFLPLCRMSVFGIRVGLEVIHLATASCKVVAQMCYGVNCKCLREGTTLCWYMSFPWLTFTLHFFLPIYTKSHDIFTIYLCVYGFLCTYSLGYVSPVSLLIVYRTMKCCAIACALLCTPSQLLKLFFRLIIFPSVYFTYFRWYHGIIISGYYVALCQSLLNS